MHYLLVSLKGTFSLIMCKDSSNLLPKSLWRFFSCCWLGEKNKKQVILKLLILICWSWKMKKQNAIHNCSSWTKEAWQARLTVPANTRRKILIYGSYILLGLFTRGFHSNWYPAAAASNIPQLFPSSTLVCPGTFQEIHVTE